MIVDDRQDIFLSATFLLEDNGYSALQAKSPEQAKEVLNKEKIALILLDMNYARDITSGEEGVAFLAWLAESELTVPTVAMTAWANVELAVTAMQLGASDFIEKPWKNQRLLQIIKQQLALSCLQTQNQKLQQQLEPTLQEEYIWRSPCMQELLEQIKSVAVTHVSILLTGENGTGKSELAKVIHHLSSCRTGAFISVNMGAISESLFESEMFGHKKGAFTDAKHNRIGRIELANEGTLFLDEIANIPLSQQVKLLRVLESGDYEILGSSHTQTMNTRIISATNGDLQTLISHGDFREDLFYRLNTLEFRVPSLREREDDIVPLAEFFIVKYCRKYKKETITLSESAKLALKTYHWPGNIRELSHLMERSVLLTQGGEITAQELPLSNISTPQDKQSIAMMTLTEAEKRLIAQALMRTNNNMAKAAKLLGLTKSSLYRRLEKYGDIQR